MNELLTTFGLLATVMLDDPLFCLANSVAWLDPLWNKSDDDVYEEGDGVGMALSITRSAFPDIYAGAVQRIRCHASDIDLDRFICGEISQRGIPLDNLEAMGYGIPLTACGIDLSDSDLYTTRLDLLPLVELFGIDAEAGPYSVDVPECAYNAGQIIADSLVKQEDEGLKQLGWTIAWLFSCSGNSLVDCTDEALMDMPPLSWDEDDLAFAVELIEEAEGMMQDVASGLKLLEDRPRLMEALSHNIKRVYKVMAKRKGKQDGPKVHLKWEI